MNKETSVTKGVVAFFSVVGLLVVVLLLVAFVVDFRHLSYLGRQGGFEPTVGWRGMGLYSVAASATLALIGVVALVTSLRHKNIQKLRIESPPSSAV